MAKKTKMYESEQTRSRDTAYLVHAIDKNVVQSRDVDDVIEEAEGLARAINLDLLDTRLVKYSKINAGHFFAKGTRQDIADDISDLKPDIIIANCTLSPVQQRNLERAWGAKVIDRTGLILEIFGARAQTKEGRLQVELAALSYQRSRLVRSWTHLERQRGGAGFMGGPGERQIEIDRRLIDKQIVRLRKELDTVSKTRDLGRQSRARVPFPIVSLVGYTNAGKSTLFNRITNADVFAEDLPFATLDPTMRRVSLPNNQDAILADTVGFISDLPTHLVASFRSTLEQVIYGDVIVHVIDVSRDDYMAQRQDVIDILKDLDVDYMQDKRIIEVYNKVDLLPADDREEFDRLAKISKTPLVMVSAEKGQGVGTLLDKIGDITARGSVKVTIPIPYHDGKAVAWLYDHGEVLERRECEEHAEFLIRFNKPHLEQFKDLFSYKIKT